MGGTYPGHLTFKNVKRQIYLFRLLALLTLSYHLKVTYASVAPKEVVVPVRNNQAFSVSVD